MLKFKFNKLVRDKIVGHQISSGARPHYYQLDEKRHKEELINKIIEETKEILNASEENVAAEIADVQQAVDDLKEKFGLIDADIAKEQVIKNQTNGPFKKGTFIDYIEVEEDDRWVVYYRENSDRYPEIK